MAPTAVSPAMAAIKEAFPEVSETTAKLVLTFPTLIMIPVGLTSAKMTAKIDKKVLLLIGMAMFLVFGVSGGLVSSFGMLLLMRGLFGVGLGIMTPLSTSLIYDFTSTTEQRSQLLGIQGASNQMGGLIFMGLSGVLAAMSWRYSFYVYAFVVVSIVLTFLFLPKMPPRPVKKTNTAQTKMSKKVIVLAFFACMVFACYFIINTDLAIFMAKDNLGDAKDCGFALSVMRIPAIFAGIMLAKIMKGLKDFTMPVSMAVMALGYLMIAFAQSFAAVMAGCLIVGLGGGFALPPISLYLPRIVTPRQRTFAIAIIMSVAQLGQFISPLYTSLFVDESNPDATRVRFIVAAITSVVIGVAVWIFSNTLPKKPLQDEE